MLSITTIPYSTLSPLKILLIKNWFHTNLLLTPLLLLLMTGGVATPSVAQPGSLDNTFGINGKSITTFGNFVDKGNSVVIQSDGKIVLGGSTQSNFTSSDFALIRHNSNGTLDSTFGINGKVVTSIENRSKGEAVAIQSDGKIVLGGSSKWYINLVRYHSDGSLDTTFGSGGKVITDVVGYYNEKCKTVAIQSDGKILVGGYANRVNNDNLYFILVRYNSDGSLDTTFGTGGQVFGKTSKGYSMRIQNDGKILLGGSSNFYFALERYNTNGTVDSTFGINGKVTTLLGSSAEGHSVAIQNNGKILLAGYSNDSSIMCSFALVRYNSDGTLDNTFGLGGKATTRVGISSVANSVVVQSDGKILLAGHAKDSSNTSHFAVVRYNSNGTLDNNFGTGGNVITPISGTYSIGNSLSIDSNEKIVLAGYVYDTSSNADIVLVRYNGNANVAINEICCKDRDSRVYPNPFNSSTTIEFSMPLENAVLNIYNTYGQVVKHIENISGQKIRLSRGNLPTGIYFVQLSEKKKTIAGHKLVVSDK